MVIRIVKTVPMKVIVSFFYKCLCRANKLCLQITVNDERTNLGTDTSNDNILFACNNSVDYIPISYYCDDIWDCVDKSDEPANCNPKDG